MPLEQSFPLSSLIIKEYREFSTTDEWFGEIEYQNKIEGMKNVGGLGKN